MVSVYDSKERWKDDHKECESIYRGEDICRR